MKRQHADTFVRISAAFMRNPIGAKHPSGTTLQLISAGLGLVIGMPAMAGCLGHPDENFCYTASAYISNNAQTYNEISENRSGETPQFASVANNSAGASAFADSAHNGTLTVRTWVGGYNQTVLASASLTYSFRLTSTSGYTPGELVPLHVVSSAVSLRAQDRTLDKASFALDQDGKHIAYDQEKYQYAGNDFLIFSIDKWLMVKPDDDLSVTMSASSILETGFSGVDRYGAGIVLDPVFEIGAAYVGRYELVGLPVAAVPEPQTWALMFGGLALIGASARRRK